MRQEDLLLPASVVVAFASSRAGRPEALPHAVTVTLDELALPELLGCPGRPGFARVLHSTAVGVHGTAGASSPSNSSELTALAQQIATDFYRHLAGRAEVCLSGVQPWLPSGLDDYAEWDHSGDHIVTRARPCSWLSGPDDLSHASTLGGSALLASYGGISVAGSAVQFIDATTTVSGGSVTLTDSTLQFTAFSELLLENGDSFLLEDSSAVYLELGVLLLDSSLWVGSPGGADLLLEDGSSALLLEDGLAILVESGQGLTISGSGRVNITTPLEVCGPFAWCYQDSPAITTSQTGYTLPPSPVARIPVTTPGTSLHGFVPSYPGQTITVINEGPESITIVHESSTAADPSYRISTATGYTSTTTGGDLIWKPGQPMTLWHDPQSQTWRVSSTPPNSLQSITLPTLASPPATPEPGSVSYYTDSAGDLYRIDEDGVSEQVSGGGDGWTKYTKTFSDFSDASTSKALTLVTLAARSFVSGFVIKHSASFTGGAIFGYSVDLGVTGNTTLWVTAHDVLQATGDTVAKANSGGADLNVYRHASVAVLLTANSGGANLDQATQGSVDVWLKVETLPA